MLRVIRVAYIATLLIWGGSARGQELTHRPPASEISAPQTVNLVLPAGTPLQVALDGEVRIRKVGQPIHGRIAEPAYAFDKLVIPVGTDAIGRIVEIKRPTAKQRFVSALYGDFSPHRDLVIEFDELILADGRHIPIHTVVSPTAQKVLDLTTAGPKEKKESRAKQIAAEQVGATKDELMREWKAATSLITQPGRKQRIKRFALSQLPFHPQYLDAGTRMFAELQEPLDFGQEIKTPEQVAKVGSIPPDGSIVHAVLLSSVSSATSHKGDSIEAVLSEPLFDGDQLILPQGTRLLGPVLDARPARRFMRNGELRITFHDVVLPGQKAQRVETNLAGVEASVDGTLSLDTEGGLHVSTPKARYAGVAISMALAASSVHSSIRSGVQGRGGGSFAGRSSNGGNGLRLIGVVVTSIVHSRWLASGLSLYGAGVAFYDHFLVHGNDVVFPKGSAMTIRVGTHAAARIKIPSDLPMPPAPHQIELLQQP